MESQLSSNITSRVQCPTCSKQGADNKEDNLVVYDDGHKKCFACGLFVPPKFSSAKSSQPLLESSVLPMHTVEAVLNKRGISPEVIKTYGVRMEQTEDGQLWVVFPLHDVNKSEYTKHLRAVDTSTGTLTRDFRYPKGSRLRLPLFGWQVVKKQSTLVICEGETDALILSSRLIGRSDVAVLGLVGTSNAERLAAHLITNAASKRVVLAFDNDTPGREAVEKLVAYVEKHEAELNLFRLSIPSQHKDIGDWLTEDKEADIYQSIQDAEPVDSFGLIGADQIANKLEEYIYDIRDQVLLELKFSPTLSEVMRMMPGKLIGIAGDAGEGKSTLAEHITMEALQQKFNVLFASQEMSAAEVGLKLLRMVRNQPLDDPRYLKQLNSEEIEEIKQQLKRIVSVLKMTDGFGTLSVDEIDKRLHKSVSMGFQPKLVIVDNLFAISKSLEANSIIDLCYRLKALARNHQTCIILLTHVRKGISQGKRTIYRPTRSDIYGSQGLQAAADCILAVASDKQKKETYVETVKLERLASKYTDVTLGYQDYCLHELDDQGSVSYDDDDEYEDEVY